MHVQYMYCMLYTVINQYNINTHARTVQTSALSSLIFFLPVMLLCLLGSEFRLPTSGEAGREFLDSVLILSFLGSWSLSKSSRSSDTHSSNRLLTKSVCKKKYMYTYKH